MFEGKKVFLFDMDGLLIDSEKMHLDMWNYVFKKHHMDNGLDVIKKLIGVSGETARKVIEEETGDIHFLEPYQKEKDEMTDRFLEVYGMSVKKGAVSLLSYLKEKDYKIILVSSTFKEGVEKFLAYSQLSDFFDERVTGDMVSESKPSPELYLKAIEIYHLNKEECIALEDSYNGIIAADGAGIDVVGIPDLVDISHIECSHFVSIKESLEDVLEELQTIK